jgi:hypothetical protein
MKFSFVMSAVIFCASLPMMHVKVADASPFSTGAASAVTLRNGNIVTTDCHADSRATAETLSFAQTSSHPFLGYGINVAIPGKQSSVDRIMDNVKALHMKWVRFDFSHPVRVKNDINNPGLSNVSDEVMYQSVKANMTSYLGQHPYLAVLYRELHASGVKVITVMFAIPDNYKITVMNSSGGKESHVDASYIKDFSQFYVAYLRVLNDFGILPDMVELLNEPEGTWGIQFQPGQLETFETLVMSGLARHHLVVNILAPGTGAPIAPRYLEPFIQSGAIARIAGVSEHIYFTPNHFIQGTIFDSPSPNALGAFDQIVALSKTYHKPIVITEFGGMRSTFDTSPTPALDLKAALDLMRSGASAAVLWDLIGDKYSVLDAKGNPLAAYYAMESLTTKIPDGANILDVAMTGNTAERMASLGYAAFEKDGLFIVGLANPGDSDKVVAIDVSGARSDRALGGVAVTQVSSFDESGLIRQSTDLVKSRCPITVTIPGGSGIVLDMVKRN